jgi:hypothetical protein
VVACYPEGTLESDPGVSATVTLTHPAAPRPKAAAPGDDLGGGNNYKRRRAPRYHPSVDTLDLPRWELGEGITVFSRDGQVWVVHDCEGIFEAKDAGKLDEVCSRCQAPLRAAFVRLMIRLRSCPMG